VFLLIPMAALAVTRPSRLVIVWTYEITSEGAQFAFLLGEVVIGDSIQQAK
jgi:hypothetical protein